ncbi:E3 ubiquitin-protein ligase TRIM11 [Syngnathus typhle]|uniref:E3 ubiquitin-protein ligase TRIM11 n=1 Tax=Syngnathus typhle TaxID=161592 RepID=UPI002A698AAD|nr:E3 ubiquitin-protein ligase TRIM11 [Syngnathus typhle]XP_061151349.1 E3 ubiquitin-protein ligase TRIM11 [Syngnathus typhle]XP_061151350.1 E3 ubiquitin-protein ligase TRIM11 [Syngnathus typhle]XP_061151351.1 E3 ubiquitin-protein ligase TRIM11 [Syngnathus typhle]
MMGSTTEELTCSVCRDHFSQSLPLPCGHSFCPACIREAWTDHGEGKGHFTCPQCVEEQSQVLCDCCSPEVDEGLVHMAVKTCLRCEVSLCAEHLRHHLERPAFSTHLLVNPLGDLSQRKCPVHTEVLRYYCADEKIYVCCDCLLEGTHVQHNVKGLRQVEEDLKVILQTLLGKSEEKVKNGEEILKEYADIDSTVADCLMEENTQVEHLGSELQVQVEKLVAGLKELTEKDRRRIVERVHEDRTKVKEDVSQTMSIQHYLTSLLAESDPFLLIWAFQSDDTKLLADLSSPLFTPEPVSLDRKHILEDIEGKYREFITATLRCLSELKRELLTSPLTLDTNTCHPLLSISDDLRLVTRVKTRLPYAAHSERFDHWPQVLTLQNFSAGTHYWELEAQGFWDIAVCYRSIGRKGKEGNSFGNNAFSWSLTQQHDGKLAAWHDRKKTRLAYKMTGNRVAVAVDWSAGTITFSEVGAANNLTHVHTFWTTFTEPVSLGFGLYKSELNSYISIVKV